MKKIAIVFPGQGSQYVGMGKELYDHSDDVKDLFKKADETLGFSITDLIFQGPEEELRQTYNTQPALLLMGYAVWHEFKKETGIDPFLVAGHSLGEYTALTANGYFSFEDAIRITRTRGLLMEEACPKGKGGMAALIGADMTKVDPVLKEVSRGDYVVVAANLNSQDQVVLSGDAGALREAVEKLKGTGYKKAVFLNVSGPFHSPLMVGAAEKLNIELSCTAAGPMTCPVVCNFDAIPENNAGAVADKLYRQMFSPVRWEASIRKMTELGAEVFIELGPQNVLSKLIKRIVPGVECYSVEGFEDIQKTKGLLL